MADQGSSLYQEVQTEVVITDTSGGTSHTLTGVMGVTIRMRRNELMTWSVKIANPDRYYTLHNESSPYHGYIDPTKNLRWKITLTSSTETKTWDYLVPLEYEHSSTPDGGYIVTVSGLDYGWFLTRKAFSKTSWKSVAGDTQTSLGIMADILQDPDLNVLYMMTSTDYPIRVLHCINEIPLDILKKILAVTWAEWWMDNQIFKTQQPNFLSAGPADWTITDYQTINGLTYKYGRSSVYTTVTARRIGQASTKALDKEGVDVGIHTDSLSYPIVNPVLHIAAQVFGAINLIYLFDDDDNYTGVFPALPPGGAATKINYNFQQNAGITSEESDALYYRLVLKGDQVQSGAEWGDLYEEDYTITRTNSTLENEISESREAPEIAPDSLIPNQTYAATNAEDYLKESARQLETIAGQIGLYIEMTPRQTIALTEYGSAQAGTFWYLEEVNHTVDGGNATTSIVASKYRSDTIA